MNHSYVAPLSAVLSRSPRTTVYFIVYSPIALSIDNLYIVLRASLPLARSESCASGLSTYSSPSWNPLSTSADAPRQWVEGDGPRPAIYSRGVIVVTKPCISSQMVALASCADGTYANIDDCAGPHLTRGTSRRADMRYATGSVSTPSRWSDLRPLFPRQRCESSRRRLLAYARLLLVSPVPSGPRLLALLAHNVSVFLADGLLTSSPKMLLSNPIMCPE